MFHEKKHEDEEILNEQNEVDFNSPEDLIELIQCKVTSHLILLIELIQCKVTSHLILLIELIQCKVTASFSS